MSSTKTTAILAVVIMMAAAFVLVPMDEADAAGEYKISYVVDETTVVVASSSETVTLKGIEDLGVPVPAGTTFDKWTINEQNYNAGSTYIFEEPGVVIATATFAPITYTATFMDGETKVADVTGHTVDAAGDAVELTKLSEDAPADLTKEGFIFLGWVAEGAPADTQPVKKADLPDLTGNVTYNAVWMEDYAVSFVDGDKTYTCKVSSIVVPDLGEREGFVFLGWYVDDVQVIAPEEDAVPEDYIFTEDTTFTAKWEPIILTVTFVAGEEVLATQPVQYGQTVNEPVVTFPEGYAGWDFDFSTPITQDTTIQALSADPVYKVTFIIDGVTYVTDSAVMQVPEASKTGYKFVGWAVDGDVVDLATYEIAADTTFTATFEALTYTVTFMDGDRILFTQTVKYGDCVTYPSTNFVGWQTKTVTVVPVPEGAPEGTEPTEQVTYTDYSFSTPVTSDLVLYGVVEETGLSVGMQCALVIGALVLGLVVWGIATGRIVLPKRP